MRTILIRYLVVLTLFFVAAAALDYWNFPLSPLNYLNRLHAVDLTVRIPGVPAEQLQQWLTTEGGAELSIRDASGTELQRRTTDTKGRARVYLHGGSYLVLGGMAAGEEGQVVFYETRGPLGLEVSSRKLIGIVELVPSGREDALRLVNYTEKLLARGEFDRALAISRQLGGKRPAGYEQVASRLGFIRKQLDEGLVQIRALQQLDPANYASSIVVLKRLEEVVSSLAGEATDVTVQFGGERFDPSRRRRSMEEARDAILASRLEVAEKALRARAFIEALVEFHAALSDPELWRPGQAAPEPIQAGIDAFQAARPELVDRVQVELLEKLARGVEKYNAGSLDDAQREFAEVVRALGGLKGELEMPEVQASTEAYLADIQVIARARVLEKEERWFEVLTAYTAVSNVNAAVRQGISEARSRQGQSPAFQAPRQDWPQAPRQESPQAQPRPQPAATAFPTDL